MPEEHLGGCLCGAVRYRVAGPLRAVIVCHCGVCRRTHGAPAAYTACPRDRLELLADQPLRWHEDDGARRGFCATCGSRLFWDRGGATISIAAGSIDEPTGLRTSHHIYTASAGDWYEPPPGHPDGTPA
jgi:hypothetical protein